MTALEESIKTVDTKVDDSTQKLEETKTKMETMETRVEASETKIEQQAADTSSDDRTKALEDKVTALEAEVPEVEKRLGEKLIKTATTLTETMCSTEYVDNATKKVTDEYKVYANDVVAKSEEQTREERTTNTTKIGEMQENINSLSEKFTTEDFVRSYVDEKLAAIPSAEGA